MTQAYTRPGAFHFVSMPVVGGLPVFAKNSYASIFLDAIRYCQEFKALELYAWCLMPNTAHLIVRSDNTLWEIMRDLKKFSSKRIVQSILENREEPEREHWLEVFRQSAGNQSNVSSYQFWEHRNPPLVLFSHKFVNAKIRFIHEEPVNAGLAATAEDFPYSSAIDYAGGKGKIKLNGLMV